MLAQRAPTNRCRVLLEDPVLAEAIPLADRARAIEHCTARVLQIAPGCWTGHRSDIVRGGIGLLVLRGLLLRQVGIDGRCGAELLGDGDLLRPAQGENDPPALRRTTGWRILWATEVAVLDERAAQRFAAYPALTGALVGRALERSRHLAVNMAIIHQARVDTRLHMLFWHLADRWGRVRTDGVILPLGLTHSVLADLVAARRPTVTTALTDLARRGLVVQLDGGWLLSGEPPGELIELRGVGVQPRCEPPAAMPSLGQELDAHVARLST